MATEAVAGALDADDDGVVEQAVEQGGGDDGVAEHLAPFGKAAVGGEDHGAALVAGVDQLKEQVPAAGDDGQVADLVDDEQLWPAEEPDALAQRALALGLGQRADELGEGGEVDAAAGLDGLDGKSDRQMISYGLPRGIFYLSGGRLLPVPASGVADLDGYGEPLGDDASALSESDRLAVRVAEFISFSGTEYPADTVCQACGDGTESLFMVMPLVDH